MEQPHYPETESTDPAYNLAFEEYVLTHRLGGDYLLLWQNDSIASHHATTTPVSAAGRATIWKFTPRYRPKGRGAAEGFAAALGQFNPPDYFGAITLDEILQTVFDL